MSDRQEHRGRSKGRVVSQGDAAASPISAEQALRQLSSSIASIGETCRSVEVSCQAVQPIFDREDATLSDQLKEQHPVRGVDDIEREHPNKWIALLVTSLEGEHPLGQGRLFVVADDRQDFERQVQQWQAACPGIALTEAFTGQYRVY